VTRRLGVAVAWVGALLEERKQVVKSRSGEFGAKSRAEGRAEVSHGDGEAKAHETAIGHDHVARALRESTDGENGEPPAMERMGRVGYLDLFRSGRWRVLERGIMLWDRLIRLATNGSWRTSPWTTRC
jgi:hypothetical protein